MNHGIKGGGRARGAALCHPPGCSQPHGPQLEGDAGHRFSTSADESVPQEWRRVVGSFALPAKAPQLTRSALACQNRAR